MGILPTDEAVKKYVGSWSEWMESVGVSWEDEKMMQNEAFENEICEFVEQAVDNLVEQIKETFLINDKDAVDLIYGAASLLFELYQKSQSLSTKASENERT